MTSLDFSAVDWRGRVTGLGYVALLAAAGTVLGVALAAFAARFGAAGPAVLLAAVLLPLAMAAILVDPRLGIVGVFATFPAGALTVLPPLQTVEVAVLFVGGVVVFRRLAAGRTFLPWSFPLWWMLGLVGWTLLALPSALDVTLATKQIAQLIAGLVFACTFMAACRRMADVRLVLGALVLVAAGIIASGLASSSAYELTSRFSGATVEGRLQGSFNQPNQLGSFCALVVLVAIGLAFGARSRRGRVAAWAGSTLVTAGLVLSLSRGAWIGFLLGVAFLLLTLVEARRMLFALSIPLIVLATSLGSFTASHPEIEVIELRARALTVRAPYDNRPEIWAEAEREIRADPWTGEGPGNFPVASVRASSEATSVSADHAHNIWLNWAAESGLPAAGILFGFCVAVGFATYRAARAAGLRGDRRERALIASLGAALISVLGQGMVDYTLRNAVLFFAVWTVVASVLVAEREARRLRPGL